MKFNSKKIILLFTALSFLLFYKVFFYSLYPFPGNYLLAWSEPYRSDYFVNGTIMLAHKPIAEDVFRQIIPLRFLGVEMIRSFQLPLWNPYNGAGQPLLATINNGFLDPFNLIFLVAANIYGWTAYIVIQSFLVGFFTFLFLRSLRISKLGSIFGSSAFMFSGFVVVRLVFGVYGLAIALLPFILYLIEAYKHDRKSKKIFFLPFAVFLLVVSTQPQMMMYIFAFSGMYALYRLNFFNKQRMMKPVLFLIFLFFTGILLGAVQLLPTYELYQYAHVTTESSRAVIETFLLPWFHLVSILVPNYFGNESTYNFWGYGGDYSQTIAYIGTIPVFFALYSFFVQKKKITVLRFFVFSLVVALVLSLDWFGSRWFYSLPIPLVSTGLPSRIFFLSSFSLCVLASYGFDSWISQKFSKRILLYSAFFTFFVGIIVGVTVYLFKTNVECRMFVLDACRMVAVRNTALELIVFVTFLLVFFIFYVRKFSVFKPFVPFALILLVSAVGIYNANKFFPNSPSNSFFPDHEVVSALQEHTTDGRVYGVGEAEIAANFASYYRIYDPQYYHPLYIFSHRELLEFANNGKVVESLPRGDAHIRYDEIPSQELQMRQSRLFDLLNVKYLLYKKSEYPLDSYDGAVWDSEEWYLVERYSDSRRAYLASSVVVENNRLDTFQKLFSNSFSASNSAVLQRNLSLNNSNEVVNGKADVLEYKPNYIKISAETDKESLLVVPDNYYPGWIATIDGNETEILRTNYTFRSVVLPEGNHTVEFFYRPTSFSLGLSVSIFAMVLLGAVYVFHKKNSNKYC